MRALGAALISFFQLPEDTCGISLLRKLYDLNLKIRRASDGDFQVENYPAFIRKAHNQLQLLLGADALKKVYIIPGSQCCFVIRDAYLTKWSRITPAKSLLEGVSEYLIYRGG
jgi:hypothetical protein